MTSFEITNDWISLSELENILASNCTVSLSEKAKTEINLVFPFNPNNLYQNKVNNKIQKQKSGIVY